VHRLAGAFALLLPRLALAQQPAAADADPLADEVRLRAVTRAALDAATDARSTCRALPAVVNALAVGVEATRRGAMDAQDLGKTLEGLQRGDANSWRVASQACDLALVRLPASELPRAVLERDTALVQAMWEALLDAAERLVSGAATDRIRAPLDRYGEGVRAWTAWCDRAQAFWDGAFLPAGERTCLDDRRTEVRVLAGEARRLQIDGRAGGDALARFGIRVDEARARIESCRASGLLPPDRAEAALLPERLDAYRELGEAAAQNDGPAVARAMEREQRVVARIARCRTELIGPADGQTRKCLDLAGP
jgi:chorismate mutase